MLVTTSFKLDSHKTCGLWSFSLKWKMFENETLLTFIVISFKGCLELPTYGR